MRESSGNEMVGWECGCPGWGWDLYFHHAGAGGPDHARGTSFQSPSLLLHSQGIALGLLLLTKGI